MPRLVTDAPTASRLAIGLPMVLAALLSFLQIDSRSLGFDEAATVTIAVQNGSALGTAIAHDGGNMSGYYLLLHVLIAAFGNSELVLRLPSALAAVATVGVLATIALHLFGRRAALAAGLLCAVSLPLVFWAQNARGYALMVAFVALAYLALVLLAADPGSDPPAAISPADHQPASRIPAPAARRRGLWLWGLYAVAMTLATYSSFVALLAVPAQLLALAGPGRRRHLPALGLALGAYALLCVPLIVLAAARGQGQLFWVPRPTREIEQQVLQSLTSAGLQPSFHATATTTFLMVVTSLAVLVVAGATVRAHRRGRPVWGTTLALTWMGVPVAFAFVYSFVGQPVFLPRNLLLSVPAVALVLGAGLASPRLPARAGLAMLAALLVLRALQVVPSYGVSPEPWQEASATILHRARPGDCIAFYPLDGRMAFQYYFARWRVYHRVPTAIMPVAPWGSTQAFVERYFTLSRVQIDRRGAPCRRLWFVWSHQGERNGPPRSLNHRRRFLALRQRLEQAFGRAPVQQLGYAAAIHIQLLPGPLRR